MTISVYLFTGFLGGSKTALIKEALLDTGLSTGERTLLLAYEEGMEGYNDDFLTKANTALVTVDNKTTMSYKFLKKYDSLTEPDRMMTEFNGIWSLDSFMDVKYPFDWLPVQVLSTVDASTFEVHLNNMHSLTCDRLLRPETIIFNRRDETTRKLCLRNNIKATNEGAQLIYETRDGQIVELGNDGVPFDPHADVIRIADDDYGPWHIDALEHPRKYEGKSVGLEGKVIVTHVDGVPNAFVSGRYAMVCYADDTSLIGLLCHYEHVSNLVPKDWVSITTQIAVEFDEEYQGDAPVLYVKQLTGVLPLDDELAYFNQVVIRNCLTCGHISKAV